MRSPVRDRPVTGLVVDAMDLCQCPWGVQQGVVRVPGRYLHFRGAGLSVQPFYRKLQAHVENSRWQSDRWLFPIHAHQMPARRRKVRRVTFGLNKQCRSRGKQTAAQCFQRLVAQRQTSSMPDATTRVAACKGRYYSSSLPVEPGIWPSKLLPQTQTGGQEEAEGGCHKLPKNELLNTGA